MTTFAHKPCILAIDDTVENIDVLNGLLRPQYTVMVALEGNTALKLAAGDSKPDLILLDIMMPGLDGYEVCRRLKANPATRNIPVIFVTAKSENEDEYRGLKLGAVDYLTKPFNPTILMARIKTHLMLRYQQLMLEEQVAKRTEELQETRLEIIRRLGVAAEYKDNETGMHVIRMSHMSYYLALASGLSEANAEMLLHTAPMHDIGKIGIPDAILLKPNKLDPEEWKIIQTHTTLGAEILGRHKCDIMEAARTVALSHHEYWNGEGYPNGLTGDDIPLFGRIVAIADVYDTLTSRRPYKQAWTSETVIAEIRRLSGTKFEPRLVSAFMEALPEIRNIQVKYSD